jgi:hypothetical protein
VKPQSLPRGKSSGKGAPDDTVLGQAQSAQVQGHSVRVKHSPGGQVGPGHRLLAKVILYIVFIDTQDTEGPIA